LYPPDQPPLPWLEWLPCEPWLEWELWLEWLPCEPWLEWELWELWLEWEPWLEWCACEAVAFPDVPSSLDDNSIVEASASCAEKMLVAAAVPRNAPNETIACLDIDPFSSLIKASTCFFNFGMILPLSICSLLLPYNSEAVIKVFMGNLLELGLSCSRIFQTKGNDNAISGIAGQSNPKMLAKIPCCQYNGRIGVQLRIHIETYRRVFCIDFNLAHLYQKNIAVLQT
jgi:hypothetical protein